MKKQINWQNYQQNGLQVNCENDKTMKVQYNGLLETSGAQEVYLHYGYGNQWQQTTTIRMNRTQRGFEADIPVTQTTEPINVCFRDNADNWDNNTGLNYRLDNKK